MTTTTNASNGKTANNLLTNLPVSHRKRALQSLPQVQITYHAPQGMPTVNSTETAITLLRSMITPEAWAQVHVYAMYLSATGTLLCTRTINVGGADRVYVDIKLIVNIGIRVRAAAIVIGQTCPNGNTDMRLESADFMKGFDLLTHVLDMHLQGYYMLAQHTEKDVYAEMGFPAAHGYPENMALV